LARSDIRTGT